MGVEYGETVLDRDKKTISWDFGIPYKIAPKHRDDLTIKDSFKQVHLHFNSGEKLFLSCLSYLILNHACPEWESIDCEHEDKSEVFDGKSLNFICLRRYLLGEIPVFEDGIIKIQGKYNEGFVGDDERNEYYVYLYNNELVLAKKSSDSGIEAIIEGEQRNIPMWNLDDLMVFDGADAENIMKGVLMLTPHYDELHKLYNIITG